MNKLKAWLLTIHMLFLKFRGNRSGITGLVMVLIASLATIAVAIPVSLYIVVSVRDALPAMTALSLEANVTDAVFENVLNAYNIASILPFVLVGGIIITALIAGFMVSRKR